MARSCYFGEIENAFGVGSLSPCLFGMIRIHRFVAERVEILITVLVASNLQMPPK